MRGRKPTPTHLKVIRGNPGRRRLPDSPEIMPAGAPVQPRFLTGAAARLWGEYAPRLEELGLLSAIDSHMFALWCCLAAEMEGGAVNMKAARIAQMRALASSFGMDPASRVRLGPLAPRQDPEDPAAEFFR